MKQRFHSFILNVACLLMAGFAMSVQAADTLVDLGDNGSNTGYASHSETIEGGATRVDAYDWVCPVPSERPTNGQVTLQFNRGQCVDQRTNKVVALTSGSQANCYPITHIPRSEDDDIYKSDIQLGQRECFDQRSQSITQMFKQYRRAYYVTAGQDGDIGPNGSSQVQEAAKAAGAAAAGVYDSCSDNPFNLCTGPRPSSKNPLRQCFDFLCPLGKK